MSWNLKATIIVICIAVDIVGIILGVVTSHFLPAIPFAVTSIVCGFLYLRSRGTGQ